MSKIIFIIKNMSNIFIYLFMINLGNNFLQKITNILIENY